MHAEQADVTPSEPATQSGQQLDARDQGQSNAVVWEFGRTGVAEKPSSVQMGLLNTDTAGLAVYDNSKGAEFVRTVMLVPGAAQWGYMMFLHERPTGRGEFMQWVTVYYEDDSGLEYATDNGEELHVSGSIVCDGDSLRVSRYCEFDLLVDAHSAVIKGRISLAPVEPVDGQYDSPRD